MLNLFYKEVFEKNYGYMCFYDKDNKEYLYVGYVSDLNPQNHLPYYSFSAMVESTNGEFSIEEAEELFWSIRLYNESTLDLGQHPTAISAAHACQSYIQTYRKDAYNIQSRYPKREGPSFWLH